MKTNSIAMKPFIKKIGNSSAGKIAKATLQSYALTKACAETGLTPFDIKLKAGAAKIAITCYITPAIRKICKSTKLFLGSLIK